jgi:hypothetical protein
MSMAPDEHEQMPLIESQSAAGQIRPFTRMKRSREGEGSETGWDFRWD